MKMSGNYLLDANVIIDVFRGKPEAINKMRALRIVNIPSIVVGELYYGAYKSNKTVKRILEIEELERTSIVLEITQKTAKIYGEIKNQLKLKGTPIPENDIWIAAIAKEHNFILMTRDRHFEKVDDIALEML